MFNYFEAGSTEAEIVDFSGSLAIGREFRVTGRIVSEPACTTQLTDVSGRVGVNAGEKGCDTTWGFIEFRFDTSMIERFPLRAVFSGRALNKDIPGMGPIVRSPG